MHTERVGVYIIYTLGVGVDANAISLSARC